MRSLEAVPRPAEPDGLLDAFDGRLPFELTDGQREIGERSAPTSAQSTRCTGCSRARSGSGKTVVALRAMLQVIDAGGQAALLAPTEVLAAQHHRSIVAHARAAGRGRRARRRRRGTRVALLTGSLSAAARAARCSTRPPAQAGIVVGTHALLAGDTCSSPTSVSSWSTSSTGSGSSSVTRCATRPAARRRTCWS